MTRHARLILVVASLGAALAGCGTLWAFLSPGSVVGGAGQARATAVNPTAVPTAVLTAGRAVTVSWSTSTLADGAAVGGYLVTRSNASTGVVQTIGAGCAGVVTATSCTELLVPPGSWTYAVAAAVGANWVGVASPQSGAVTVQEALSLTQSTVSLASFTPGPNATLSGSLTGFASGEGITYHLDSPTGATLSGSPASVASSGNATVSITLPRVAEGAHTVYVVGSGSSPSQASEAIVVDTVAPTSSASGANSAWHASAVTVTLSATDPSPGTGVASIAYTVDGGATQTITGASGTVTIAAPANHSDDGAHTISFAATDNAGNVQSPANTVQVKIDTTPPSTTDNSASVGGGWSKTTKTVTLTAIDAGSGVAATYYTTNGSTPTTASSTGSTVTLATDGVYTIEYFSVDNVGNQEAVHTASTVIHIDKTAPVAAALGTAGAYVSTSTYVKNGQPLTDAATDPTVNGASSGVASVAYDDCPGTSCTPATLVGSSTTGPNYSFAWTSQPADGTYRVMAIVTDNAGNTTNSAITTLVIDNTAPATTDNSASVGGGWSKTTKTVTLTATDAGSGVAATYYTTNGSTPTTASSTGSTVTLATDGVYTIEYFSVDNVGNQEAVHTASTVIHIDKTAPVAAALGTAGAYVSTSTYVKNGQPLTDAATDPTVNGASSGVASVAYDDCPGTSCTPATLVGSSTTGPNYSFAWTSQPADGTYRVMAIVTDNAGNTTNSAITTLVIDNTAPATTDNSAGVGGGWSKTTKTVTLTATDAGSGVAATYYTTNGSTPTTASSTGSTVTLATDGVYTIEYFSVDNVGNQEAVHTASTVIHIDKTAPVAAALGTAGAYVSTSTYVKNGQPLTDAATDPTVNGASSGVASVAYDDCPGTSCTPATLVGSSTTGPNYSFAWTSQPADGTYRVMAIVTDNAGNTTNSAITTLVIDNTAPTLAATLADSNANEVGYIHASGDYYAYANVTDAGSGVNAATIAVNVANQSSTCSPSACSAVPLTSSGGPFTIYTASGPVQYTYRSALLASSSGATASYSTTAQDNLANSTTAAGTVSVGTAGNPSAPSAVTLTTGVVATSYSVCSVSANGDINAAGAASETITVTTSTNFPADGVVALTVSGGTTSTFEQVLAASGSQTATFADLNLAGLTDGTITLSAVEYTPGGNGVSSATTQTVTKLTTPPTVSTAAFSYTDKHSPAVDTVTGGAGAGPASGFLQLVETVGTQVGGTFSSAQLATDGSFAKLNLAAESSTPTYSVTAADAACNLSTAVAWSPTDTH